MNSIRNNGLLLLLPSTWLLLLVQSSPLYQNDYEPRVFDHIPLNCYDCLSYQDIILTQLTNVPARAFAHFNLGSRDTNMILNGQLKLFFEPYAFQSLIVQKPNRTLTLTFAAPNSWLNITEHTFHGLELRPYSTLRIIIKFFYGCTFHRDSLSGIKMGKHSRLIIDLSAVTQIYFQTRTLSQQEYISSIEFIISRTDTIVFDSHSFSNLIIDAEQSLSFHYELVSHVQLKPYSFQSLQLQTGSSFRFYSLFLNRLTMDSFAFQNMSLDSNAIFNLTIQSLGTCLCVKSHAFDHLHQVDDSRNIRILFSFFNLRGLSFFPWTFANLSLNHRHNQLKIISDNPSNDPNPIVNFASNAFSSKNFASLTFNFTSVTVVKFEERSLQTDSLSHDIYFKDVTLVDLSALNSSLITTNLTLHFDHVHYTKWFRDRRRYTLGDHRSSSRFYFDYLVTKSCVTYQAPRSASWLFPPVNTTVCNCPLLYAYKHGQLDGQFIPCLRVMSGEETARKMNDCQFEEQETICSSFIHSLTNSTLASTSNSLDSIDPFVIRQLYDRNYLTCSYNYSSAPSTFVVRSRLFDHLGLVIGVILAIFIVLLILVMALLNGLQYKMREYDEGWTWRENMSWTSLRRTISQTSLRRSRRDLRTLNGHGPTSKSDNRLDRHRFDQQESDDQEIESDPVQVPCLNSAVQI